MWFRKVLECVGLYLLPVSSCAVERYLLYIAPEAVEMVFCLSCIRGNDVPRVPGTACGMLPTALALGLPA
jgi:hypothetical protein